MDLREWRYKQIFWGLALLGGIVGCVDLTEHKSSEFKCDDSLRINSSAKKLITMAEFVMPDAKGSTERLFEYTRHAATIVTEKFPNVGVVLLRCEAKSFNPLVPVKAIEIAKANNTLATVGFAWSSIASIAANAAGEAKHPYFSATAVTNEVHKGTYSFSLGVSPSEATNAMLRLLSQFERPEVVAAFNPANRHELQYIEELEREYTKVTRITFESDIPSDRVIKALEMNPKAVLFIPGYNFVVGQLGQVFEKHPGVKVIAGPQWTHDYINIRSQHEHIYSISNYFNIEASPRQEEIRKKSQEPLASSLDGYFFALLDTAMLVAAAASDSNVKDSETLMTKLGNYSFADAIVKGEISIRGDEVFKPAYITRYMPGKGFRLVEEVKPSQARI